MLLVALLLASAHLHLLNLRPTPFDLRLIGQSTLLAGGHASMRVILWNQKDDLPAPNCRVELSLAPLDGSRPSLTLATFTTDAMGSAAVRFETPDWPAGLYQLRAIARTSSGRERIEHLLTLKREIDLNLQASQPIYHPGQTIHASAQANLRARGTPLGQASATWTLTDPRGRVVLERTLPTSDSGRTWIDYPLADPALQGVYSLQCRVAQTQAQRSLTVIDAPAPNPSGEAIVTPATATPTPAASPQPATLHIEVVPESPRLVRELTNRIYVLCTYSDGSPAPARVECPLIGRTVDANELGVACLELTPRSDAVDLSVAAQDPQGLRATQDLLLRTGPTVGDFLLRTERCVFEAQETIPVVAMGIGEEPVYLDVLHQGQTVLTGSVAMRGGRGEQALRLPPTVQGAVTLVGYRFDARGTPAVKKSNLIYVHPKASLHLEVYDASHPLPPNTQATLSLRVTDAHGLPRSAAVSASLLRADADTPPPERDALPAELAALLAPWSPHRPTLASARHRREWEQAIFSRAALDPLAQRAMALGALARRGDLSTEALLALQSPRLDEHLASLESAAFDRGVIDLLHPTRDALHDLAVRSHPRQAQRVEALRERWLRYVHRAWAGLGATLTVLACALVCVLHLRSWAGALTFIAMMLLLAGLFLPPLYAPPAPSTESRTRRELHHLLQLLRSADRPKQPSQPGPPDQANSAEIALATTATSIAQAPATASAEPTLLWRPDLVSDEAGFVKLDLPGLPRAGRWLLDLAAVDQAGRRGQTRLTLLAWSPLTIELDAPRYATRGDEFTVDATLRNDSSRSLQVTPRLAPAAGLEVIGQPEGNVSLWPGQSIALRWCVRAAAAGVHALAITAQAGEIEARADQSVTVEHEGRRVEFFSAGTLQRPAEIPMELPADHIPSSVSAHARLLASTRALSVHDVTPTPDPGVPTLHAIWLRLANPSPAASPDDRDAQRLRALEAATGGMRRCIRSTEEGQIVDTALTLLLMGPVEPSLRARLTRWLVNQRRSDGSWPAMNAAEDATLATTALASWAAFAGAPYAADAEPSRLYLLGRQPPTVTDLDTLALLSNALWELMPDTTEAQSYVDELQLRSVTSDDGRLQWWRGEADRPTITGAVGRSATVQSTALGLLAIGRNPRHATSARRALAWLVTQRLPEGTWGTAAATCLTLKAVREGVLHATLPLRTGVVDLTFDSNPVQRVTLSAQDALASRQIDLTSWVGVGRQSLWLLDRSDTAIPYEVRWSYHVPHATPRPRSDAFTLDVAFSSTGLATGEPLTVQFTLTSHSRATRTARIDWRLPPGFRLASEPEARSVWRGEVHDLPAESSRTVTLQLHALKPGRVCSGSATVLDVDDPARRGRSGVAMLTVAPLQGDASASR